MKKCTTSVLTVLALLACQPAHAGRITMQLTEQEETANGKTLCRYENSIYSFSYVTLSNIEAGQAVKIPAMTGSQLHLLMMWLQALRE
ncbi:hypothetical protein M8Q39_16910 [Klebsiella quasipneumoniae]|nr:hypothetical protein [Klebsiella quasipneumoniae]MCL6726518.1 hypothetical protein [Klebsiella quasipneumoniae]